MTMDIWSFAAVGAGALASLLFLFGAREFSIRLVAATADVPEEEIRRGWFK